MNLIQKIALSVFRLKAEGFPTGAYTLRDEEFVRYLGQAPTWSGATVSEKTALSVATFYSCVRVLSETVGSMPWAIYERDSSGNGNSHKVDHDLSDVLLGSPNDEMTSVEFKEALTTNLAVQGNVYSFIERRESGNVSSLYPIPSVMAYPERDRNSRRIVYKVLERGKWETYPQEKIWHVKGFGSNGLSGFSPLGYARQTLGTTLAASEFQAKFFANGASPSWLISIPQWLDADKRVAAQKNLDKLWGGTSNAFKAQLLEGGMTATPATMPLDDAQFLGLSELSRNLICGIMRVPPHMVADLSRSTNNNIEHQSLEFGRFSITPYSTRIEASAARWLLKPEDRKRFFLRFNMEGLLRGDTAARAAFYTMMLQNGVYNRNDVRALENLNRVEGLDEYTVQSNMTLVDKLSELIAAQIAKAATAPVPAPQDGGSKSLAVGPVHLNVNLPSTTVNTSVEPAQVSMYPEYTINTGDVAVSPPDMEPVAKALQEFAKLGDKLVDELSKDSEVIRDKEGNMIGTRKKRK